MSNVKRHYNCPKCHCLMQNMGNVEGTHLTVNPPKWMETHACHHCKVRKKVLVEQMKPAPQADVSGYEEVP